MRKRSAASVPAGISRAVAFVTTNVQGTVVLLEATRAELALASRPFRFVHVGTDEVHGTLVPGELPVDETAPEDYAW